MEDTFILALGQKHGAPKREWNLLSRILLFNYYTTQDSLAH